MGKKVSVVLYQHWEDIEILGVYANTELALVRHSAPHGCTWEVKDDGTAWMSGQPYGYDTLIQRHEVHE